MTIRHRKVRKTLAECLAAIALGFISNWAAGAVVLIGTPAGRPGDQVELSIAVTAGTTLVDFTISPLYGYPSPPLVLSGALFLLPDPDGITPTDALTTEGSGQCANGTCSFIYIPGKLFTQQSVLATLRFAVADNAESFITDAGSRTFPLDLGVSVEGQDIPLPEGQRFKVLEVPEPSSMALLMVGVMSLLVLHARRRSDHALGVGVNPDRRADAERAGRPLPLLSRSLRG